MHDWISALIFFYRWSILNCLEVFQIMKKYIYLLFIICLLNPATDLFPNASTAGNTVTVNRDSGFNALRSPALMSWEQDDSMGLGFVYSMQVYNDTDGTVDNGLIDAPIDAESESIFKGIVLFSYILRSEDHSFGVGIRNSDDAQFVLTESSQEFTLLGTTLKSSEEKEIINVSSVFSYSYRLNNRQTLGIQAETGYAVKTENKNTKISSGPTDLDTDIETENITATLSIGYSYIGSSIEMGLLLNTGEFSIEKKSGTRSGISGGAPVSGSGDSESDIYQSKGYGLMAGISFRPYYKLLLNFEAGTQIPFEDNKKTLNDDLLEVNSEFKSSGVYLVRTGADYLIDKNLSVGVGAGYIFISSNSDSSDAKSNDVDINLFEFTTGCEYRFSDSLSLLISCNMIYIIADMGIKSPGMEIDLSSDTLNVNFATGVSMSF